MSKRKNRKALIEHTTPSLLATRPVTCGREQPYLYNRWWLLNPPWPSSHPCSPLIGPRIQVLP